MGGGGEGFHLYILPAFYSHREAARETVTYYNAQVKPFHLQTYSTDRDNTRTALHLSVSIFYH